MPDVIKSPLMPTCSLLFRNILEIPLPEWTNTLASGDMMIAMMLTGDNKDKNAS